MFFFELPPQFKHVLRYILYLLYVHSLIHRFHNEREDEEGEGGGVYQSASSIVMRRICAVADANEKPISNTVYSSCLQNYCLSSTPGCKPD